jgi:hypothetical protein
MPERLNGVKVSVLDILRDLGGCEGGQVVYKAAKAALAIRHPLRTRRRLRPETILRLQPLYPTLDLRRVSFVTSASLPANWFSDGVVGMTFGYQIWFAWTRHRVEETDDGLKVLMHELVHVDQVRKMGNSEDAFACAYGAGFLEAGDYRHNPLEIEAFDFVDAHPVPPPAVFSSLCFYDRDAGNGQIYAADGSGQIRRLAQYDNWRTTWDIIHSGAFAGSSFDDVLFYDRNAGAGEIYASHGDGRMRRISSYDTWRKSWDIVVPGNFGGDGWTDLLFYDRSAGEAEIYTSDGHGGLHRLATYTTWRTSWDLIVPGDFGGGRGTDLLLYDRRAGEAEFLATDGAGGLHNLSRRNGLRTSWDKIVPGRFSEGEWTDSDLRKLMSRTLSDVRFFR